MFAMGVVVKRKVLDRLQPAQQAQFSSMLQPGSKEMNMVIDYFFAFIEGGLAKKLEAGLSEAVREYHFFSVKLGDFAAAINGRTTGCGNQLRECTAIQGLGRDNAN